MHAPPDMIRALRAERPAPRGPVARRAEAGVSIVLAMLVLFVLVVVLFQVRFTAAVEMDHARAFVDATRMGMLADAAFQQAQTQLMLDVDQPADESGADGSGGAGGMGGLGGAAGGGGGLGGLAGGAGGGGADAGGDSSGGTDSIDGGTGSDEAASIADTTASTDSLLDEWQESSALAPALGQDYTMYVEVEDEDSKINLLGLWNPDKEIADKQREIVMRVLDKAFEGTSRDLSIVDATDILDKLNDWVAGNRGSFDPIPVPKLKLSNKAEEEADGGLDTSVIDTENNHYPLTIGELADIEGFTPERLAGFVEDDIFYPGLERYLTVCSNLEIKPKPKVGEDLFGGSPFTQGSLFDKKSGGAAGSSGGAAGSGSGAGAGAGAGAGGSSAAGGSAAGGSAGDGTTGDGTTDGSGGDEEETFDSTNDGLVNANTAPLIVLRALAPDDIPTSFLEKVIEYRLEIKRLQTQGAMDATGGSLFDKSQSGGSTSGMGGSGSGKGSGSGSSGSGSGSGTGAGGTPGGDSATDGGTSSGFGEGQEDENIVDYVFTSPDEVVDKVEQKYYLKLNLDPGIKTDFTSLLTTTSQVFTVKILILDQASKRRASYRGTVWRLTGGEHPEMVTLMPLEAFYDPRRLKDFPEDLSDASEERFTYAADKLAKEQQDNSSLGPGH